MFRFASAPRRRGVSLTPMIDVVFLLLVFFMLVSRFGVDLSVPLSGSGAGAVYDGPPRLVSVAPDGLRLNGVEMAERPLLLELVRLTESGDDLVILQPERGADVQRLVSVIALLGEAGFNRVSVVGAAR